MHIDVAADGHANDVDDRHRVDGHDALADREADMDVHDAWDGIRVGALHVDELEDHNDHTDQLVVVDGPMACQGPLESVNNDIFRSQAATWSGEVY